jgi:hypothetical protein
MTSAVSYGYRVYFRICFAIGLLSMTLWGCTAPNSNLPINLPNFSTVGWKTYSNSRYKFEFPYPENWQSLPAPENHDGIAFISPQNPEVQIRGWAGKLLPSEFGRDQKPNFQTKQGIKGTLLVEVTSQTSVMTLNLTQGQIKYYWQGHCNSQNFDKYYRFFYYIAQEYKVKSAGS